VTADVLWQLNWLSSLAGQALNGPGARSRRKIDDKGFAEATTAKMLAVTIDLIIFFLKVRLRNE